MENVSLINVVQFFTCRYCGVHRIKNFVNKSLLLYKLTLTVLFSNVSCDIVDCISHTLIICLITPLLYSTKQMMKTRARALETHR